MARAKASGWASALRVVMRLWMLILEVFNQRTQGLRTAVRQMHFPCEDLFICH